MASSHPRVPEVESAFTTFSENDVDLGEPLTSIGRDLAKATIAVIEMGAGQAHNCPLLYREQSFIAGSLGRRTQEKPLDDVDVYLVLEAPVLHGSERGRPYPLTSQYTRFGTPLIDDSSLSVGGNISADAVLDRFVAYLPQWFPDTDYGKGRAGKTCFVKHGSVNIDLSPVIWFKSDIGGIDEYWMPAGNGNTGWRRTNPKEDQRLLSHANQVHEGELLKIIRMMKWWNVRNNGDRLKGIHLETLIVRILDGKTLQGWANSLTYLFTVLYNALDASCSDPTKLGDPLDSSLAQSDRQSSKTALANSALYANFAVDAANRNDVVACLEWWRRVFPLVS